MIDFHAHIIPGIDDGAENVSCSVDMLRMLYKQGINKVVASPHFYPGKSDAESFLKKRDEQFNLLIDEVKKLKKEGMPDIVKACEVYYFPTIHTFENLKSFCIEGTNYMLLEMPFIEWSPLVFESVHKLISNHGIIPIIAHADRYIPFGNKADAITKLKEFGAVIQLNADFFTPFFARRKAFSYIEKSLADVLGSDCHNTNSRKPNMNTAISIIEKRFGRKKIQQIESFSEKILENAVFR